jgi:aryl-alcohol dehydrogenase-like predicted oxidoreductase
MLKLGDVEVTRTGLGTNRLTNTSEHVSFVHDAVAPGVSHIDTAYAYTGGESEETIGAALSPFADRVIVATKGTYSAGEGRQDVLQAPIEESLAAIKEYRDSGKIRHAGLSQVGIDQIEVARELVAIAAVQNQYNLTLDHLKRNLAALEIELSDAEFEALR